MAYKSRLVLYLISIFELINLSSCNGTTLPPFRQLAHHLQSGPIEIINATALHITKFYYDGNGTDVHFWAGKGVPSPSGFLVPDEYGSKKSLGTYVGKNMTINLPDPYTIAEIDYLAVWSTSDRDRNHNFGHVFMNERFIRTNRSRLILPLKLAPFNTSFVTSYSVIIVDELNIEISRIYYTQNGSNVHFRVGRGRPSSNGKIVANEYGSFQNLPNYNAQNITLRLPDNVSLQEIDYLTVWNNDTQRELGTVYLDQVLQEKRYQEVAIRGIQLNKLNVSHGSYSGPVLLINEKVLYIPNFHHSIKSNEFRVSLKNGTALQIPDTSGSYDSLGYYNGESFYLTLPATITAGDINKFGIWNISNYLTYIDINSTIDVPYTPNFDVTDDGKRIIRVQKCCPFNEVVTNNGCEHVDNIHFNVEMKLHAANDTHLNDEPMTSEWLVFVPYINNIICPKYYLVPEMDNYSLLTTGKLLYISAKVQLPFEKYCLDNIYHTDEETGEGKYINTVFVCAEGDSGPQTMHIVFATCAFLSAISLFLTAVIYYIIRKQDDKRGFSIAGYAVSMGVAFLCLGVTQVAGLEAVCNILGGIFHFFIVMSFVWFVAVAYEAFYHVKYFEDNSILMGYIKRRNIYLILSFAVPLFFVVLTYILDLPAGLLNPHIDAVCLFNKQKWMLYIPIIIGISVAIVLAGLSLHLLSKNESIKKEDKRKYFLWKTQKRDVRARVRFCLFVVALTTACWLSEIITFSLQFPVYVIDVIHALQGVFVFTTVLSTGGVFKKILKFFGWSAPPSQSGVNGDVELMRLNNN